VQVVTDWRTGTTDDVRAAYDRARGEYSALRARGLKLNLGRGKPSEEQLDLSNALLSLPGDGDYRAADGTDCRNYGGVQGLPEIRAIFAPMLGAPVEQVIAAGNASLTLMHDAMAFALRHGVAGGRPWAEQGPVTFLCPVPGYDRHFTICDGHGVRMLTVPLTGHGPDMDAVESIAGGDASVKGMWCVPKYSNPTGEVYADEVVERLARMKTAAPDFRLFWDNAYGVHHLTPQGREIANILALAERHGNADRPFVFASTSKITFAGSGVAFFASSAANVKWMLGHLERATIGPDKINQLRHARLLKDANGLAAHMQKHARSLAPKFQAVDRVFTARLGGAGIAAWTRPEGGYFVSLDVMKGCATRTIALAKDAGIVVVPAGSTFPYGSDPEDRNIRIAPSYPTLEEVELAAEGLALSVLVAAGEAVLAQRGEAVATR
jgi:DNA-binding transcriptional MocR family regulator